MKKILTVGLVLTMAFAIAGCGGVNSKAAAKKFNDVNGTLTEVSMAANENIDVMTPEVTQALTAVANDMISYKAELESSELTQERADEIEAELEEYPPIIEALGEEVNLLIGR